MDYHIHGARQAILTTGPRKGEWVPPRLQKPAWHIAQSVKTMNFFSFRTVPLDPGPKTGENPELPWPVAFLNPGSLRDGELELRLMETSQGNPRKDRLPLYRFDMVTGDTNKVVGSISLRIHNGWFVRRVIGHIGYRVEPAYRGNRFAARACRLLLNLARRHRLNPLWITCNPDNLPSIRTIESLGGELTETVNVPRHTEVYRMGDKQKRLYRVELY